MIDISHKEISLRIAYASGKIKLKKETIELIRKNQIKKGNVIEAAKLAGIMGGKETFHDLPHCHMIPIESIDVEVHLLDEEVEVNCQVKAHYKTGVEMEALNCVSRSLLTIWDMVKYLEKDENGQYPSTEIKDIKVTNKIKN